MFLVNNRVRYNVFSPHGSLYNDKKRRRTYTEEDGFKLVSVINSRPF